MTGSLTIRPVTGKRDRKTFIDLPFRLYKDDPNWVPPLKREALGLLDPEKNGWYSHAKAQLFLAERDGRVVGRISAHIDLLALDMPAAQGFGPGTGQWGLMEAEDDGVFRALIAQAAQQAKALAIPCTNKLARWSESRSASGAFQLDRL